MPEMKTYLVEQNGLQFTAQFTEDEAKNLGLKEIGTPARGGRRKKTEEDDTKKA